MLVESLVPPCLVIVGDELLEHAGEVAPAEEDDVGHSLWSSRKPGRSSPVAS